LGDRAPVWYISMDQYLQLVVEVVKSSGNTWSFSGKQIHDHAHPEDLMASVTAAAENVALTLTALGRLKPHLFEEIETGKPKK